MHRPRINLLRLEEELSEVHLRLSGVIIEHLSWQQFVKTYDKPDTLFFFDPPYYKAPYYAHNFGLDDFEALAETLCGIKSNFICTINDHPEMRRVFKGFKIKPVSLAYTTAKEKQKVGNELIITNFNAVA